MSSKSGSDAGAYVVYKSKYGTRYHERPTCAAKSDVPSAFDKATDALENVEMYRVRDIEANNKTLCSHCANTIRDVMGIIDRGEV